MSKAFAPVTKLPQARSDTSVRERSKVSLPEKALTVIGHSYKRLGDQHDQNQQTFGALVTVSPRSDVEPITINNDLNYRDLNTYQVGQSAIFLSSGQTTEEKVSCARSSVANINSGIPALHIQEEYGDNSLTRLKDDLRFKLEKIKEVDVNPRIQTSSDRLSHQNRQVAQQVFHSWLDFHHERKRAWEKLIRLIYQREKSLLGKLLFEMKLFSRNRKILRLKYTLCSHNHYRHSTKVILSQLKINMITNQRMKQGLQKLSDLSFSRSAKTFLSNLVYIAKIKQKVDVYRNKLRQTQSKGVKTVAMRVLKWYVTFKNRMRKLQVRACAFASKFLKFRVVTGFKLFMKMQTNHLASMRTVEAYIHQKRRQKVLAALKQQINESRTKMDMNRAACKFRLFRYTLLLKATTFRALKQNLVLMRTTFLPEKDPLQLTFNVLKNAKRERPASSNNRRRYWQMWRKQIKNKTPLKRRNKYLSMKEEMVNDGQETQLCLRMSQEARKSTIDSQQIQTEFNQMVNIPKMQQIRATLLYKALHAPLSKTLKRMLYLVRNHKRAKQRYGDQIPHIHDATLLNLALKSLSLYLKYRQRVSLHYQLARKFAYMHQLLGLFNLLRRNVQYGKRIRQKKIEAVQLERELTLKKGLNLLYKNKLNGNFVEQKLQDHILSKNNFQKYHLFSCLKQYYMRKQDSRLKVGMAIVKRESVLIKETFRLFKGRMSVEIDKTNKLRSRLVQACKILAKQRKQRIFSAICRVSRRNRTLTVKVEQIQDVCAQRMRSEMFLVWRIVLAQQKTASLTEQRADGYRRHRLGSVLFNTYRGVKQCKLEQSKRVESLIKKNQNKLLDKVLGQLTGFVRAQKQKRQAYYEALSKFDQTNNQKMMFKLLRVGAYWRTKEKQNLSFDLSLGHLKSAFFKWKRVTEKPSTILPTFTAYSQRQDNHAAQPSQTQQSDVLDWLKQFGQKPPFTTTRTATVAQNSSQMQPAQGRSLAEFDQFLQTIKGRPSVKSPEFNRSSAMSIKLDHQYEQRNLATSKLENRSDTMNLSKSSIENKSFMVNDRTTFLKSEIQKFLQDKQLLRRLEEQIGAGESVTLLQDGILARSRTIEMYCNELKQIKEGRI